MSGFFAQLARNLRGLPQNLWADLHPAGERGAEPHKRMRRTFAYHLHPPRVTERALWPMTTLGLGVLSIALFGCLCVSGALLMIYYVPTPQGAHPSMLDIQHAVAFGSFLRALHRWAAHGMVITVALHLIRVFAQGAYRRRELNHLFGLGLLLLTLGLAITGYLLPWDQRSFWAVTVSANLLDHLPWLGSALKTLLLGGDQIGQSTLLRFYMLHVALLPTGLLLLAALHLWRIRQDGGLAIQGAADPPSVPSWPHLVLREGILVLSVVAAFSLLATTVEAPLGAMVDAHLPSNPQKAPWYLLWLQEMVSYSAPVGGVVYPGLTLLLLVLTPLIDREDAGVGRWFGTGPTRMAAVASLALAVVGFVAFEWLSLGFQDAAQADGPGADWLNPAGGMIALSLLVFFLAGWRARSTRAACNCALIVLLVGVLGCVSVGLCRGPNWVFYWPWEAWPLAL